MGTRRASEKLAMPKVWRMRSATTSGGADGPGTTSRRPMSAFTLVPGQIGDRAAQAAHQLGEEPGPVLPLERDLLVVDDEGVTCHSSR